MQTTQPRNLPHIHFSVNTRILFKLLCNKNQLGALFILTLFPQSTSTCFGHICSPSSGGRLYIYNNWYVLCIYARNTITLLVSVAPTPSVW